MSRNRKLWNEHVKLVATLLNAIAIGVIGVAIIGPLAQPENPFYGWVGLGAGDKLADLNDSFTGIPWYVVIEWRAIFFALAIHGLAHLTTRLQVDE